MSSVINLIIVWTLRNSPYWKGNSDYYIRQIPLAHMLFRTLPHGLLLLLFYTQVGSKQFTYCWSQAGFRKGRGTRDQIANICWIIKMQESSRKTSISALLTMPKLFTVWITINCGKFFRRWEYRTTWPTFWETYMQVRKQQLKLDMEHTGSK